MDSTLKLYEVGSFDDSQHTFKPVRLKLNITQWTIKYHAKTDCCNLCCGWFVGWGCVEFIQSQPFMWNSNVYKYWSYFGAKTFRTKLIQDVYVPCFFNIKEIFSFIRPQYVNRSHRYSFWSVCACVCVCLTLKVPVTSDYCKKRMTWKKDDYDLKVFNDLLRQNSPLAWGWTNEQ